MALVSIIIPCYNYADFVAEAIASASGQTFQDIEIIIVNDNSIDCSKDIILKEIEKDKRIKFIDNKCNKGVVATRNIAIEIASGKYILPLDADDVIDSTYVEKAVKILEKNPDIGIVYCNAEFIGKNKGKWLLPEYNFDTFLNENCIFNSALFRKDEFIEVGMYKENLKLGFEDWDLWLSLIETGLKPYKINETLFYYRCHEQKSRSIIASENLINCKREILRNHFELFINNDTFVSNTCSYNDIAINKGKYHKYKNCFNITLSLLILVVLLFLYFVVQF